MADIITNKFKQYLVDQLVESTNNDDPNNLYIVIAKNKSWANESSPPTPIDNVANTDFKFWRNVIFMKKILNTNVSRMTNRHDWIANTVYEQYRDKNAEIFSNNYFVFTDDYNVYKCLLNNRGANSTIKPTGTSNTNFTTSDGYTWKYMFTISPSDVFKFAENNYIPVKKIDVDDGSTQWNVQQSARSGIIDVVDVVNTGNVFFNYHNGTVQSSTNTTVVKIASSANNTDDVYNGSVFYINSGLGAGQYKEIIDYNGTSKNITLESPLTIKPNSTSNYKISPKITISGNGSNAAAIAIVNTTLNKVESAFMVNNGLNYSHANVSISANGLSGVVVDTYIAPYGGHGSKAYEELNATNILFNVNLNGDENGRLFYGNNFRKIGLILNPIISSNNNIANSASYDLTTRLGFTSNSGAWTVDEKITGGTSGAFGTVAHANTTSIRLTDVVGNFSNGEIITGSNNSYTATINLITKPVIEKFSGELLYVNHIEAINRTEEQTENIKILIKF